MSVHLTWQLVSVLLIKVFDDWSVGDEARQRDMRWNIEILRVLRPWQSCRPFSVRLTGLAAEATDTAERMQLGQMDEKVPLLCSG